MKMETLMNIISNIANFREGCELYIFDFCILFVPCACDLNHFPARKQKRIKNISSHKQRLHQSEHVALYTHSIPCAVCCCFRYEMIEVRINMKIYFACMIIISYV